MGMTGSNGRNRIDHNYVMIQNQFSGDQVMQVLGNAIQQSTTETMTSKINFASAVAALILFLLPWIDIQCSGTGLVTQTGLQTIYGGASISSDFKALADQSGGDVNELDEGRESMGMAWLTMLAFLIVIGAVVVAFLAFRYPGKFSQNTVGLLCLIALLLLILQMVIGFPAHREISEAVSEAAGGSGSDNPFDAMGAGMMAAMIQVRYLPWIYLELVALAVPTLLFLNQALDKVRKT